MTYQNAKITIFLALDYIQGKICIWNSSLNFFYQEYTLIQELKKKQKKIYINVMDLPIHKNS